MDPNATLHRIIVAALEGDAREMLEAAEDLAEWLERGGFPPSEDALRASVLGYDTTA